jgi:hypothetical protein
MARMKAQAPSALVGSHKGRIEQTYMHMMISRVFMHVVEAV